MQLQYFFGHVFVRSTHEVTVPYQAAPVLVSLWNCLWCTHSALYTEVRRLQTIWAFTFHWGTTGLPALLWLANTQISTAYHTAYTKDHCWPYCGFIDLAFGFYRHLWIPEYTRKFSPLLPARVGAVRDANIDVAIAREYTAKVFEVNGL